MEIMYIYLNYIFKYDNLDILIDDIATLATLYRHYLKPQN